MENQIAPLELDLDPETIVKITEEQAEEIEGGAILSCLMHTCKTKDL